MNFRLLCLLLFPAVDAGLRRKWRAAQNESISENRDDCFPCLIQRLEVLAGDSDDNASVNKEGPHVPHFSCITRRNGVGHVETYKVSLSREFLADNRREIEEGRAQYCIPGGYVSTETHSIVVPQQRELQRMPENDRRGSLRQLNKGIKGNKKLLVVRVTTKNGSRPPETLSEIEGAIFGTGKDSLKASVASQYKAVSHGALNFKPSRGPKIKKGMLEIEIDHAIAENEVTDSLTNVILEATEEAVGESMDRIADYAIFCLPSGSLLEGSSQWFGFTYLFHPYSYYQNNRCTKLSVVVHEVGHSLGFAHSGWKGDEYGDKSGYMGYVHNKIGIPEKAFNGHKYWVSRWLQSKSIEIDIDRKGVVGGRLVAFVDYDSKKVQNRDAVLICVGDLYIAFNRARGFNIDTDKRTADKVTITKAKRDQAVSDRLGELSRKESYTYPRFLKKVGLTITICDIIKDPYFSYAVISIHLEDGKHEADCNAGF